MFNSNGSNQPKSAEDVIRLAAEIGAKTAIKTFEREKTKVAEEWHDKRLFNTKLLLRNYRTLNEHINSAVFEKEKLDDYKKESAEEILELMWQSPKADVDVIVNSIKKSVERTRIIMEHVNMMLELYETFCIKSNKEEEHRRWRVINAMYISPERCTAKEIAVLEHIEKRTVYRDIDIAVERISSLIFGINGLSGK